jgi:PilZ domain
MFTATKTAMRKPAETGADRRAFGRRKTWLPGTLRMANRSFSCTVRDISEGGALLEFEQPINAAGWLKLSFEGHPEEILCEPRHENGNTLGVQFARPMAIPNKSVVAPAPAPMQQQEASPPGPVTLAQSAAGAGSAAPIRQPAPVRVIAMPSSYPKTEPG